MTKKNAMNVQTFCRTNRAGTLDFYLIADGQEFYLFTTRYFSNYIFNEYRNGKRFQDVFSHSRISRQQKLRERIYRMAKYISEENDLNLFAEQNRRNKTTAADDDHDAA